MKHFRIIDITLHCTLKLEIFVFLKAFFRVKTLGNCFRSRYRNQRELELN